MDENISSLGGGIALCSIGLILLAVGAIPVVRTLLFLRAAVETTGTIVDLRVAPGDTAAFQAVVEFETHEGKMIRWTQFGWRSRFPGNVGDEIPMKYNPQNPNQARTADAVAMWVFGAVFSSVGLLLGGTVAHPRRAVGPTPSTPGRGGSDRAAGRTGRPLAADAWAARAIAPGQA